MSGHLISMMTVPDEVIIWFNFPGVGFLDLTQISWSTPFLRRRIALCFLDPYRCSRHRISFAFVIMLNSYTTVSWFIFSSSFSSPRPFLYLPWISFVTAIVSFPHFSLFSFLSPFSDSMNDHNPILISSSQSASSSSFIPHLLFLAVY